VRSQKKESKLRWKDDTRRVYTGEREMKQVGIWWRGGSSEKKKSIQGRVYKEKDEADGYMVEREKEKSLRIQV